MNAIGFLNSFDACVGHAERFKTNADFNRYFETNVAPEIIRRYGKDDKVALRTAWNDELDAQARSGAVSEANADRWTPPTKYS